MYVKFILPALVEAHEKYWRAIKYSLFPPLGLATLAGYLETGDHAEIVDEHVEQLRIDDEPDLVAIETYVTSAYRAYKIADTYRDRGIPVVLGGLHATACPEEAAQHSDSLILGPAGEAWP
ncbi:MAG: cobalamin-dependent protein, partial [Desulfosarcinaceae bacterium]